MSERRSARSSSRSSRAKRQARREREQKRRSGLSEGGEAVATVLRDHPKTLIATAITLLVIVMLYGPIRSYYVAVRTNQELQARYEAIVAQNDLLTNDVERLQSEEGIEDEAHRRGWVKDGENSAVVQGLPEDDLTELLGEVEVEDTRPWYIKGLDIVFFYDRDNWQ